MNDHDTMKKLMETVDKGNSRQLNEGPGADRYDALGMYDGGKDELGVDKLERPPGPDKDHDDTPKRGKPGIKYGEVKELFDQATDNLHGVEQKKAVKAGIVPKDKWLVPNYVGYPESAQFRKYTRMVAAGKIDKALEQWVKDLANKANGNEKQSFEILLPILVKTETWQQLEKDLHEYYDDPDDWNY